MKDSYKELSAYMKEIQLLGEGRSILGWDMETVMPVKGSTQREATLGILARISHEWFTSEKTKTLLKSSSDLEGLSHIQLRNLELW